MEPSAFVTLLSFAVQNGEKISLSVWQITDNEPCSVTKLL